MLPGETAAVSRQASRAFLTLDMGRRDRDTGEVRVERAKIDVRRVAIIVLDMWNLHWCKTATWILFALKSEYRRFVARVGICESMLKRARAVK